MNIAPTKAGNTAVKEGIEAKISENVEYPDVIGLIDKLGPDTPLSINLVRARETMVDKQGISPAEIKKIMDEWLKPCGNSSYCEGTHSIDSIEGMDSHTIYLEYGVYESSYSWNWKKEKPFEKATITYSVRQ